ncbi:MAG TPA: hypothetical protein VMG99_09035 [Thermoplasmata archaeon]|nr:hypothetical protein [Thermoplasmata archaeon]
MGTAISATAAATTADWTTSAPISFDLALPAGGSLYFAVLGVGATYPSDPPSASDSQGNDFGDSYPVLELKVPHGDAPTFEPYAWAFYADAVVGGADTVTVDLGSGAPEGGAVAAAFAISGTEDPSGDTTSSPYAIGNGSGSATPASTGSFAVAAAGELVLVFLMSADVTGASAPVDSFSGSPLAVTSYRHVSNHGLTDDDGWLDLLAGTAVTSGTSGQVLTGSSTTSASGQWGIFALPLLGAAAPSSAPSGMRRPISPYGYGPGDAVGYAPRRVA